MFEPNSRFPTNQYLYHFTKKETALEKILPSGKLRLGSLLETNDPRETQKWLFTFAFEPGGDEGYMHYKNEAKEVNLNQQLDNAIKKGCKVLCFCKDYKPQPKTFLFGRGYQRPSLWAHYAENHRGACLIFDKKKLIATAKRELRDRGSLYVGDVKYQGQSKRYDESEFKVFYSEVLKNGVEATAETLIIGKKFQEVFYWKHDDWKNECEYRFLLRSNDDQEDYVSITESLRGIIFGCDFPLQAYQPIIQKYMNIYHMSYGHMQWRNGLPALSWYGRTLEDQKN